MAYEIVAANKQSLSDEQAVRAALAKMRPDWIIENVEDKGDHGWLIRLFKEEKTAGDPPAFLKEKKDENTDDTAVDDAEDSSDDSDDSEDSEDDSEGGDDKKDSDAGTEDLVHQLEGLVKNLTDIVHQVSDKAQGHKDKLDKAKDILGDPEDKGEGLPPDGPLPADLGPVPGGPPAGAGGPPRPPRRPGVPSGGAGRPGAPSAFGKRQTEVVTHPGTDGAGNRISLVAAASELQADPQFKEYEVTGMVENRDGTFSAKLKLKS